jgi:ParB/RepB/Spo0J family partition protein
MTTKTAAPDHSARNTAPVADPTPAIDEEPAERKARTTAGTISAEIALADIRRSPTNPRTSFDQEALDALATSIAEHGVLEPLIVRRRPNGDTAYELIAGERRYRAAQAAGLTTVPCRVVLGADDRQALELQALENLQRAELDAVEEAVTFRQLAEAGAKQAEIAKTVGKSQPYVANRLRILELPADVQDLIRGGKLTAAHGVSLARFSAFPAAASVMAAQAVKAATTSKELDGAKLPFSYELERRNLATQIGQYSSHTFDTAICEQCPYGAYRAHGSYQKWCLKPEHAEELSAAHRAEREAQHAAASTQLAAASPDGQALRADSLKRDAYTQIFDSSRPPGCTGDCPCLRQAIQNDWHGNPQIITICTDPERYAELRRLAESSREKQRQQLHDDDQARALAAIADSGDIGRDLAVLALVAVGGIPRELVHAAGQRQADGQLTAPDVPESWAADGRREAAIRAGLDHFTTAGAANPYALVRFALDALFSDELYDRLRQRERITPLLSWYVGDAPSAPQENATEDEDEDDYPTESDWICERCGEPIIVDNADQDRELARLEDAGQETVCGDCTTAEASQPAEAVP